MQLLHPNCPRYFSPDDLASLDLSIPSLCTKANAKLFYFFVKLANDAAASLKLNESFFPLYQGGLEVNSDLDKPVKSAKVGQDVEEDNSDTEDVTTESDKRTNEGGKKDPFLRRQELLVNSGLAEVGNPLHLCMHLFSFFSAVAVWKIYAILHLLSRMFLVNYLQLINSEKNLLPTCCLMLFELYDN